MSSPRCDFHPVTPSKSCRICKSLILPAPTAPLPSAPSKFTPKKQGIIPIHGDKHTYNLSTLVRKNMFASQYFNELMNLKSFNEVLAELITHCKYVEPWTVGTNSSPSTLFCCLYRVFHFKISEGQMKFMLEHENVYVRCMGALYLRILCDPAELWPRLQLYVTDPQQLQVNPASSTSFGEFVELLLAEQSFYGVQLPRVPILIQRELTKHCLQIPAKRERQAQLLGAKIEKDTPVIVLLDDGSEMRGVLKQLQGRKAQVLLNSGEVMHVGLGDVQMLSSVKNYAMRDEELEEVVRAKELERVLADSKAEYVRRPQSYKSALSLPMTGGSKRARSRSPSPLKETEIVQTPVEPTAAQLARLEHLKQLYCSDSAQGQDLSKRLEKGRRETDDAGPESLRLG